MSITLQKGDPWAIQHFLLLLTAPLARSLILNDDLYGDKTDPFRQAFADNPDDVLMHESDYHQWGVISHSRQIDSARGFAMSFLGGAFEPARSHLSREKIDHLSKWQLCLVISPAVHDWGKFTKRVYLGAKPDGRPNFNFEGHEQASGFLVRRFRHFLTGLGLTYEQVEYIARCAELHFELGKVRKIARKSQEGYTFDFIKSSRCEEECQVLIKTNPDMAREIGVFFAVDSLAKVEILAAIEAKSDADLIKLRPRVEAAVKKAGLPERYIQTALNIGLDLALARRYFTLLNKMTRR